MNAALLAVAAQQQGARDELIKKFSGGGATHHSRAIAFAPADDKERELLVALEGEGVIKRDGRGRFYADLEAKAAKDARTGYQLLVALSIVLSVAISVLALVKLA